MAETTKLRNLGLDKKDGINNYHTLNISRASSHQSVMDKLSTIRVPQNQKL